MRDTINLGCMAAVPFWGDGKFPVWKDGKFEKPACGGSPCGFGVAVMDTVASKLGCNSISWTFHGRKLLQKEPVEDLENLYAGGIVISPKFSAVEMKISGLFTGVKKTLDGLPFLVRCPYMDSELPLCEDDCWDIPYWAIAKDGYPDMVLPEVGSGSNPGFAYARLVLEPQPVDLDTFAGRKTRLLVPGAVLDAEISKLNAYDLACRDLAWRSGQVSPEWGQFTDQVLYIDRNTVLTAALI